VSSTLEFIVPVMPLSWHFDQRLLDDVPYIFGGVAEFTACHTGTQTEIADADGVVLVFVRKVVPSLGHGSDKDTNTFLWSYGLNVVVHPHDRRFETQCDFSAVWRKMIRNGVLDDTEELFLRRGGPDGQALEELHHQPSESLKGTWDSDGRIDLDKNSLGSVDVDLQLAGLVDG
jgi:hypothetical protein